ncbi:MAG: hypothetical protein EA392_09435 [Cryomorphaceae bacterium]|nr:MAG: hypothetical protein EA392_09435 [Cryomorphaceae bacterium]
MKRLNIFDELREITQRLKPFEGELALQYLVSFSRKGAQHLKSHEALQYMLDHPNADYDELLNAISPGMDKYDFNKFLTRLRDKIFDSLTLRQNILRRGNYSEWYKARQLVTKNWILITNLLGRGNQRSANLLMSNEIQTCETYELYDLLVSILRIKLEWDGLSQGEKAFSILRSKITEAEKKRDAVYLALEWNTRFYMAADRKASQNEQVGLLTEALSELQRLYNSTKSATVGQYVYLFEMEYFQALGDYNSAGKSAEKMVHVINASPALRSDIKLSSAYVNLAYNHMLMHEFDHCQKNIELSLRGAGVGSYNFVAIKSLQAQTYYFQGNLNMAWEVADTLLQSDLIRVAPFERSKMVYLQACILFNRGQFSKAYERCNSEYALMDTDPEGWNVGVRILSIMCLMEMQLLDLADLSIDSLRKHLSKNPEELEFASRDKAILKILRNLERTSFDFAKTYFNNQDLFYELESDHSDYAWKIRSHEYVVFHHWFLDKIAKLPYQFKLPQYTQPEPVQINEKHEL